MERPVLVGFKAGWFWSLRIQSWQVQRIYFRIFQHAFLESLNGGVFSCIFWPLGRWINSQKSALCCQCSCFLLACADFFWIGIFSKWAFSFSHVRPSTQCRVMYVHILKELIWFRRRKRKVRQPSRLHFETWEFCQPYFWKKRILFCTRFQKGQVSDWLCAKN